MSIAIVSVGLYWPARGAGFVGDDFMILHRLQGLTAPGDLLPFFRAEFFQYYRPLGFVSHALDWLAAGADPGRFHLTNIFLHAINAAFVLLVAQALSPRSLAGPLAALLFAVHASNHEAVVWVSARFDLLATAFGLAAVCWMVRAWPGSRWAPALLFFAALLSKESVVALPLVALAWGAFVLNERTRDAALRAAPWLAALVAYSVLREVAGGISAVGGASRLPKVAVLGLSIVMVLALSGGRWQGARTWLVQRRATVAVVVAASLTAALLGALLLDGAAGHLLREKLSVAGFAAFYLTTPLLDDGSAVFSDPTTSFYYLGGGAGLALCSTLLFLFWRPLLSDGRFWFIGVMLVASLLPVSALTEGKRYLYLPSAGFSILLGLVIVELPGRWRKVAVAVTGVVLAVSAVQVHLKIRDWIWAGTMTADGGRLVDAALAPACDEGHVVFLTSPVGIRGIYTHFYYETFELPRGCIPEVFQVVARVQRHDIGMSARWDGPGRIVMTVPHYAWQFVAARDFRVFDIAIGAGDRQVVDTALGRLESEPDGSGLRLTLTLAGQIRQDPPHFFYYSAGEIRRLE